MKSIKGFGEIVEGYNIPVLNEREIRASAGILFLGAFVSLMFILFENNFIVAKNFVVIFLLEFIIRMHINPKYAPSIIIGRLIVKNQKPEYVGALQKKFAWTIGIILASVMFIFLVVLNTFSAITGIICLVCLIFLFFESAFGICLGCIFYKLVYKEKAEYCPGETCEISEREAIQKVSLNQLISLLLFLLSISFLLIYLSNVLHNSPENLWSFF